ncbi:MAG: UDP-N-acetylmuramoyl-L-alanyl-D-glutamate--2,6-diaminopimelate ligase, partial [bacterium]
MKLNELLSVLKNPKVIGNTDKDIENIAYDSRKVGSHSLFIAIPGFVQDGTRFIPEAVKKGAVAVVTEKDINAPSHVTKIIVGSARKAQARLANKFYNYPSRDLVMIAVTGTNGKTTTVHLLEHILRFAGKKVGMIGTVGAAIGKETISTGLTTPDSPDLQALLKDFKQRGATHVVMEVSSHSLALHRVMGCEFDVAVFTNLTHDHLDFHKMMSNYISAKKKLFDWLGRYSKKHTVAIVNRDDTYGESMVEDYDGKIEEFSMKEAKIIKMELDSMEFEAHGLRIKTSLVGEYNVYNFLAAIRAALNLGIDAKVIEQALNNFEGVPGRFEKINAGQPFSVIVDFAHSPDSLQRLLKTIKGFAKGRIILVFGCPGDRDRTKRPMMGQIAFKLADYSIITTDDPHFEKPELIIKEIEKGFISLKANHKKYKTQADRKRAIQGALDMAKEGDVVILAGRGHEKFQD